MTGFASVPAVLGQWGNTPRTDRTPPLQTVLGGGAGGGDAVIELRVFMDGQLIETFF